MKYSVIALVLILIVLCRCVSSFDIIWNVPTQQCRRNYKMEFPVLLRQYGIIVNDEDEFIGDEITTYYDNQLGLYPKITDNGTLVNGGVPQLGDLEAHLKKAKSDLQNFPKKQKTKGVLRVIDWEAWRPTWEFNWYPLIIYQEKSKDLVRITNQNISSQEVARLAEAQWTASTKEWMLQTLLLAKKIQPNGIWGYYLFPDCYNYKGNSSEDFQCPTEIKKGNNKLQWLWDESTGIFPSVYVYKNQLTNYNFQQRTWFTNGRLQEALRVANPKSKIYAYVNFDINSGVKVPKIEFWRVMAQAASLGLDGVIIWGGSASVSNENLCLQLRDYITDIIGPASEKIKYNTARCSKEVCNSFGKCTWSNDSSVTAWKIFTEMKNPNFHACDIQCRCKHGFTGRFCQT